MTRASSWNVGRISSYQVKLSRKRTFHHFENKETLSFTKTLCLRFCRVIMWSMRQSMRGVRHVSSSTQASCKLQSSNPVVQSRQRLWNSFILSVRMTEASSWNIDNITPYHLQVGSKRTSPAEVLISINLVSDVMKWNYYFRYFTTRTLTIFIDVLVLSFAWTVIVVILLHIRDWFPFKIKVCL